MGENWQMNDKDYEKLGVELGPIGWEFYYLWNAVAPTGKGSGDPLSGWCLAYNQDDDLVFLKTEGYYSGYLLDNPAGGSCRSDSNAHHFVPAGIDVKSRESDYRFMVLEPLFSWRKCPRDLLVKHAKWWGGYEVIGKEKEFYIALIKVAREEKAKKDKVKEEQEEKAREEEERKWKESEAYHKKFMEEHPDAHLSFVNDMGKDSMPPRKLVRTRTVNVEHSGRS
ncbi:uncharacterized protein BO95DRAFT_430587 [Aspergillus brunneoviolaceus CBS 621.78]|uniref:Uncharacterized protein n=1 Tax=Aspergillus brunneoviolaceus CBS 621.78 TaxID=1450534 RepID=A0ACD1GDI7_9EURO|nr:hypothetical protein BO95DRAFT_430587 [Aspergillus brunneoviolaceus CBS 621.78]RAH47300.1 hypothetical protein BO95DRAFT_430587 [Aspergillus brunneoviolaceus CBS 621.78]